MDVELLSGIFDSLDIPVLVSADRAELPVMFMNRAATLLFSPGGARAVMPGGPDEAERGRSLGEVLRFVRPDDFAEFDRLRRNTGQVANFFTRVRSSQGDELPATLTANRGAAAGEEALFVYVGAPCLGADGAESSYQVLTRFLEIINHAANFDEAVNLVLGVVGRHLRVSRVYVFEEVDALHASNTYEWCAERVEPAIDRLQMLPKADYSYDAIVQPDGMIIASDIARLPERDREILAWQGIRAIAILPLYHLGRPFGYVGVDDCTGPREWGMREIRLLQDTARILSAMLNRRDTERHSRLALEAMRTVLDNLDEFIYISDPESYELKFVSDSMATAMHSAARDLVGGPCWRIFNADGGPCDFCPLATVRQRGRTVWELCDGDSGKHYLMKNSLITWTDGKPVHLATAVDISYRKRYEEQLKLSASTDAMTKVYNRQWGFARLQEILALPEAERRAYTLSFLDIDDLKQVNDEFGHAMGDELIINTIQVVHANIRKNDVICRWGGDEFILILNCALKDARTAMKNIEFALGHFNATQAKPYRLSLSYGLADFASSPGDVDALVSRADEAMYRNKAAKRTRRGSRTTTYRCDDPPAAPAADPGNVSS